MVYQNSVACFFIIHCLLLFSAEGRANVPAIIVFGDSTVDAGNNNQIITVGIKPSIPAYLDPNFGIEDFATGVTFASGGTGYDNLTALITTVLPLWRELEYFKDYKERLTRFQGKDKATKTLNEALYIISLGTVDFLVNYFLFPIRSLEYNIDQYEKFLSQNAGNFIKELYNLGARKISISGSAPMGCLPMLRNLNIVLGRTCFEFYNKVGRDFNEKLMKLVENMRKQVDGIQIVFSDIYDPVTKMIQNPYLYGFEEVKRGCCGTGMTEVSYLCMLAKSLSCKDPTKYIFWDALHTTDKANGIIADILVKTSLAELI
ncbi:GDSL esterase/lipase At4g26790-like isoform X2 [Papaver somniferum]|uniref:GDSL esterase/lipase At4g26790-like isoform X2 n=1 Tax=Papaver somniferum TaxID=3469 RepID=UPI000E7059BB|nr:GDSL esterase/lipase At4g26790-like isoform X2 [Papaver somniferum]